MGLGGEGWRVVDADGVKEDGSAGKGKVGVVPCSVIQSLALNPQFNRLASTEI